jgi:hypothetical protein
VGLGVLLLSHRHQQQQEQKSVQKANSVVAGNSWRPVDTSLVSAERVTIKEREETAAAAAMAAAEEAVPLAEDAFERLARKLVAVAVKWPLELQLQLLVGLLLVNYDFDQSMAVLLQPGYKLLQGGEGVKASAALVVEAVHSSSRSSSSSSLYGMMQSKLPQQQRQQLEKDLLCLCQSFYPSCCKVVHEGRLRKHSRGPAPAEFDGDANISSVNKRSVGNAVHGLPLALLSIGLLKAAGWQLGRKKIQALLGPLVDEESGLAGCTPSKEQLQLLRQVGTDYEEF